MKLSTQTHPLHSANSTSLHGQVTDEMIHARTRELSSLAGREASQITQADYEQAKRELTGEPDLAQQALVQEKQPELSNPGSQGQQTPESPSEDEDEEGRSKTEQLVNLGSEEAKRDRRLQAARAATEKE